MSVSFKIERTLRNNKQPNSRHIPKTHLDSDSSDNDADHPRKHTTDIQFISDFDSIRESNSLKARSSKQQDTLSIPALPDRDFRAIHLARKQKRANKELYRPEPVNSMGGPAKDSAKNLEMVDAEGLDKMNSKPVEGGLKPSAPSLKTQNFETLVVHDQATEDADVSSEPPISTTPEKPLTMEERAVKELLAQANPESTEQMQIEAIPMKTDAGVDPDQDDEGDEDEQSGDSGDETAQFRRDVSKRPDSSTLEDYERIPVGQFGLALLKGMGWKEGTAATKRGRVGLVEAYIPQARPSLLGIGAKPMAVDAAPTDSKKSQASKKPDKKYVPLLRKVIDHGGKPRSRSRSPASGRSSASPSSYDRSLSDSSSRAARRDRESTSHRDRESTSYRERESTSYRDRDSPSHRDRDSTSYRDRDSTSYRERDSTSYRDRDSTSYRDRDSTSYRDRDSTSYRDRDSTDHRSSRNHESRHNSRDDDRDERDRSRRDKHPDDHCDDRRASHRSDKHSHHPSSSSSGKKYAAERPSSRERKPSRYD
ncbi:hypothetical protein PCANC_21879 [Puccinia coronata f. sp. avenae]|uniref:G-patch domain-containing protein n=1 Tax=Puccinia coronata f. sp. avenae TaxID=200324 RepID=A0A2N5S689_9BASI|nr:hypothetical protein PCANC_21879 [Puccinia coronata f. sp. avenae]